MFRPFVTESSPAAEGTVLEARYRLVRVLVSGEAAQGTVWLARDAVDAESPVVLHQVKDPEARSRLQRLWPLFRSMSHPQVPRCGDQFTVADSLWLVRAWQEGSSYESILRDRAEAQQLLPVEEVLQLLHQLLQGLSFLHGRGLVHGHLALDTVIRRQSDGVPVLIALGSVQFRGESAVGGARVGVAPQAQLEGSPCEAWMDFHALGVLALCLLSGQSPDSVKPQTASSWSWPGAPSLSDAFRTVLLRLISDDPQQRFSTADQVVHALGAIPASPPPLSTPKPQLPALEPDSTSTDVVPSAQASSRRLSRAERRAQGAEGNLWPVVLVLALSAVFGSGIGWYLFARGASGDRAPSTERDVIGRGPQTALPPQQRDQRQQLFSRLRALQIDRTWFQSLIDRSLILRSAGGTAGSTNEAAWTALAQEWVARLEQLPPGLRRRLGSLGDADWQQQEQALVAQGVSPRVVKQLVSAAARDLLPGDRDGQPPREPYRQLWIASAMQSLKDVSVEQVTAVSTTATNRSTRVVAGGARLITIVVPTNHQLVLGINGTPLMAMTVFDSEGEILQERGPLRVLSLPISAGSPIQVLVTNAGMSSALLTLACRADPTRPSRQPRLETLPEVDPDPVPDSATGAF